jgi:hypothetical protein
VRSPGQRSSLSVTPLIGITSRPDLRSSAAWTGLLEAYGSLVEVLVEAASSGGTGTSCWSWRGICGMSGRSAPYAEIGELTVHQRAQRSRL